MAVLGQLHRVTARPAGLADDAKTRSNTALTINGGSIDYYNDLFLGQEIVNGALAGAVATVDAASGLYTFCGTSDVPWGLFGIDASGEPNEYNKPKEHGKITLVSLGFHEVEVYETRSATAMGTPNSLLGNYDYGLPLYASEVGFLTIEDVGFQPVVAYIEKPPTASDPIMIVKLVV